MTDLAGSNTRMWISRVEPDPITGETGVDKNAYSGLTFRYPDDVGGGSPFVHKAWPPKVKIMDSDNQVECTAFGDNNYVSACVRSSNKWVASYQGK